MNRAQKIFLIMFAVLLLVVCTSAFAFPPVGRTLEFDGIDHHVNIADSPVWDAVELGDKITIEAWFRVDA